MAFFAVTAGIPVAVVVASHSAEVSPRHSSLGTFLRLKVSVFVAASCHGCMSFCITTVVAASFHIDKDPGIMTGSGSAEEAVSASLLLSACVGALSSFAVDALGRRRALMSATGFYISGSVIMASAVSLRMLLLGCCVVGFGVGICSVFMNIYITEIAPAQCRGQLSGWSPFFGSMGALSSHMASTVLGPIPLLDLWRWQLLLIILPSLCVLLLQGLLIESPRWLLLQGLRPQARASIAALYPRAAARLVDAHLLVLERDIGANTGARQLSMLALLRQKPSAAALGCGIGILQQMSGISTVVYLGPVVLKHVGFSDHGAMVVVIGIMGSQCCASFLCAAGVDLMGRRRVAIIGMLLMMAGLVILSGAFAAKSLIPDQLGLALAAVVGMVCFRIAYSFSLEPLPHIMTGEFFAAEARAAGAALSFASLWGASFVARWSYPTVETLLTPRLGKDMADAAIFGGLFFICAICLAVVLRALPETAGLQLERAMDGKQTQG